MGQLRPFLPAEHVGGVSHYWEDLPDGSAVIHSVQDVAPALDRAKAMRTHNSGYSDTRNFRRVAFVPDALRQKWLQEEGWDAYRPDLYADKLAQKFMDPDYAHLRTADGRVGATNGKLR